MAVLASLNTVPSQARKILERLVRATKTSQQLAERARIVLWSAEGWGDRKLAKKLAVDRQRVRRWRKRWAAEERRVLDAVGAGPRMRISKR